MAEDDDITGEKPTREVDQKWSGMLMSWIGEEVDFWGLVGRVRGGWEEQLQVLRSAPLMMMMMDTEEQFKAQWKRRWRKAISGDPEKRVRDHMGDKEVQKRIKLVDTASFTLGVFMVMFAEYLFLVHPGALPWFYLITYTLLMLLRFMTYKAIHNHFFMLDFCYFLNVSVVLQSLLCSSMSNEGFCSSWLKTNFVLSNGPIAVAILAWQNSVVFHSMDKMTSFYIHIMPALTCYLVRWNCIPGSVTSEWLSLSFAESFIIPLVFYSTWQAIYLYIQSTVIDKDPELVTSLRYLTQCPKNPMYIITQDVYIKLGFFKPGEKYNSDELKTKMAFVIGQFFYVALWLIPVQILFYFQFLNSTFLFLLMLAGLWRGGSYYVFVFSKIYNNKFEPNGRKEN